MGKKKLDEFFQEKFLDFSEMPDEKVWQALEASLDKKKDSRRIIPIWWRYAGVAAGLLIAFWAFNPFAETDNQLPAVTDTDTNTEKPVIQDPENDTKTTPLFDNDTKTDDGAVVTTDENTNPKGENSDTTSVAGSSPEKRVKETVDQNDGKQAQKAFAVPNSEQTGLSVTDDDKGIKEEGRNTESQPFRTTTDTLDKVANTTVKPSNDANRTPEEQGVAINNDVPEQTPLNPKDTLNKNNGTDKGLLDKQQNREALAQDQTVPERQKEKDSLGTNKKKSIFDEIKEQEEEAVAENDSEGRWSAGPSIAPVFYSAFGEGSPVHSIFVPNSKSGETNLSYGLSVAYEINEKLSVRSGVHRVDYGYGTNDIEFTSSLEGSSNGQIDNIDYSLNSRSLVVQSKAGRTVQSVGDMPTEALDINAPSAARDGTMSQQFGYLEVPLELNYALMDKKFGINLIGGFSSLFLVDNSVALTSGNETLEMGEANNVNNLNFSTNVGIGVNYNFNSSIRLNIEPMFKYQLNTFSTVDGTFQPFSVGVYSGLSFRF
ncbi:hypothetical protein [Maribacter sp. 2-571]|uniref:hypothetical protein n=1 Tax=Maribacter sp. 2-571 TaxID=3417569 RepID=UPI003D33EF42